MQTSPCGHQVVCRKCFVKTIQIAVSQRLLPLRCVICRAKILRLKVSDKMQIVTWEYIEFFILLPDWSDFAIVSERLLGEFQVFLSATVGQSVQRQQRQLVDIFHVVFFREQRWLPISRRGRHGRLLYQRSLPWWCLSTATHRSTSSLPATCDEDETAGVLQE